jgi:3-deoxy-manno-octulosonate cytidylyltransferase (CMP-KDO synthetase)
MPDPARPDQRAPCIIIPARFASTRFPGKPLVRLKGQGGAERTLIEWSWRAAAQVKGAGQVVVATDDFRIRAEVERFGGVAVMTPADCANGTERCAAAIAEMATVPEIVVNFQGDAPLTPPAFVAAVIERLRAQPTLGMATPAIPCRGDTLRHLMADRSAGRVGGTTVVFNREGRALYFSKNIIPFIPDGETVDGDKVHLHLGIYAYRRDALAAYRGAPSSPLELIEGLEQLRFLDMGQAVGVVVCPPPCGSTIELNNPTDVPLMEHELLQRDA